ncbi:MAG: hypothetical protein L0387_05415 [Acidobacteria bacterium]|nr:hypothetical protein [Acidobacteriota bacterium]MCI0717752.1 hypothetical protein [Acidobacteriota bacterium]
MNAVCKKVELTGYLVAESLSIRLSKHIEEFLIERDRAFELLEQALRRVADGVH